MHKIHKIHRNDIYTWIKDRKCTNSFQDLSFRTKLKKGIGLIY